MWKIINIFRIIAAINPHLDISRAVFSKYMFTNDASNFTEVSKAKGFNNFDISAKLSGSKANVHEFFHWF